MELVERAKNLILRPKLEWPVVEAERPTTRELFTHYVLILAAIGPAAPLIGMSIVGVELPFMGRIRMPLLQAVLTSLFTYGLSLGTLFIFSYIVDWLGPTFGGHGVERKPSSSPPTDGPPRGSAEFFHSSPCSRSSASSRPSIACTSRIRDWRC